MDAVCCLLLIPLYSVVVVTSAGHVVPMSADCQSPSCNMQAAGNLRQLDVDLMQFSNQFFFQIKFCLLGYSNPLNSADAHKQEKTPKRFCINNFDFKNSNRLDYHAYCDFQLRRCPFSSQTTDGIDVVKTSETNLKQVQPTESMSATSFGSLRQTVPNSEY